uniref:Uncharacterized protein n=1 Tax=Rhizophagus irregularis (strain DAOM 181602 / DAOM 197198 / MUCL 43194) TaxID=747089 RepID=U9UAV8_RHIID
MEKRPLLIPSSYQKNSNKQIIKLKESWHEIFTKFHRIIKSSEIYTRLFISYVIYLTHGRHLCSFWSFIENFRCIFRGSSSITNPLRRKFKPTLLCETYQRFHQVVLFTCTKENQGIIHINILINEFLFRKLVIHNSYVTGFVSTYYDLVKRYMQFCKSIKHLNHNTDNKECSLYHVTCNAVEIVAIILEGMITLIIKFALYVTYYDPVYAMQIHIYILILLLSYDVVRNYVKKATKSNYNMIMEQFPVT